MASLPQDIVFDIFIRLPTKPFVRSKCLSKHWNRLISDYFMKSRSRRMILLPFEPLQAIQNTFKPSDGTVHLISTSMLPSPFNNLVSEDHVRVVGTFDGIVIVVQFCKDMNHMILFNPLTGAYKIVPDPPLKSSYASMDDIHYGFCCGTTLDDLKIFKLVHYSCRVYCDVFSLKKGLWSTKSIELKGRYSINYRYNGMLVNGFLYWHGIKRPDNLPFTIALDVKKMVFSEIQLPCFSWEDSLCSLNGRLHLFHPSNISMSANPIYELWVMNDDGTEKSWSKVFALTSALSVFHLHLSIIDTGKIVVLDDKNEKKIIIYDMFKDSYAVYNPHRIVGCLQGLQAIEYVESLISPSHLFSTW